MSTNGNEVSQIHSRASQIEIASSKALEKVLVYIMYTAIVGSAVYFYTKLDSIEKNIAQHHGQDWDNITNIVQTSQIQNEVSNVRKSLDKDIEDNETTISKLDERLKLISKWIEHNDKIMSNRNRNIFSANALYDDFGGETPLCKVNKAHLNGSLFEINDLVSITNEDSSRKETINCKIDSTINDSDEGSVLYSLNVAASRGLSFTKEIGRIHITTNHVEISEERRWKTIDEF